MLDKAGIKYERSDNCFPWIEDPEKAQEIADTILKKNWRMMLDVFARRYNPLLSRSSGLNLHSYYWTVREGEYATDVVFKSESRLAAIYQQLTRYAIANFSTEDVLRFLGRRTNCTFSGEITCDLKRRFEGVRVKHRVEENSIKMYDKKGRLLRIETTINNPRRFKVYRKGIRKGKPKMVWIPMRKSIADIYRRVEISRAANARYLDALFVLGDEQPSHKILDKVSRSIVRNGRRYRALRPVTLDETNLFRVMLKGEYLIRGFRNVDLRKSLYPKIKTKNQKRRATGRITRLIRILRAHRLVRKIPKTRLYMVTKKGHIVMNTALTFRQSNIALLANAA
jgi:hypothetical protein